MPTIDDSQGVLVVRIVYDGPAFSGKTTSLKSLARGVASKLECPEEREGRTLYFDWMEYVGGLYEGRQISCQIVSVPGQAELAHRRRALLESADAVVCVLDTRRPELDFGLSWLSELAPRCRTKAPPVGIVLQANKRDANDAVPLEELRLRVNAIAPIAIVESVAMVADGIREAFVLSVRLALDRVRALSTEGKLETGEPSERDAADLMQKLVALETRTKKVSERPPVRQRSDPFLASLGLPTEQVELELPEGDEERVFVPDPMMPGGMIWPPVDGRALLHEVASLAIRPQRTASGGWWGSGAGWRFHSSPRALYEDANEARHELIGWARLHSANAAQLSEGRAVILADAGRSRLRLWQLVREESALRERLDAALSATSVRDVVSGILEVATQLLHASEWFASGTVALPCTLWTVGSARSQRPVFVGLIPALNSAVPEPPRGAALLERELLQHLRVQRRVRVDFSEVQRELITRGHLASEGSAPRLLAEVVRSLD